MNIILLDRKPIFIFGFVISFFSALLFEHARHVLKIPVNYSKHPIIFNNPVKSWSQKPVNYKKWRKNYNIQDSEISFDEFLYGTESNKSEFRQILEADWLKQKISVTCVVFVKKLDLATTIKDTWGKRCNNLLFFSENISDSNLPVVNLKIKYSSSWQLLCEVMNYIWKRKNKLKLQWLIFVKDDTFVISENLRYLLAPLDFQEPYYLGHAVVLWGLPYNVAQAGYLISYETLHKLMEIFDTSKKCASGGKYRNNEDYYLAKHLAALKIYPEDTSDSEKKGTFHGFSLSVLLWGVAKTGHYYTRALYPWGSECCSNMSVTFNVGEADKMRTLYYVLYHLHLFKKGTHGNKQAPTEIPDHEVWKVALREEFNLTEIQEISNDQYFQIWRSKYIPERFISNFRSKAVLLDSYLEPYDSRYSRKTTVP